MAKLLILSTICFTACAMALAAAPQDEANAGLAPLGAKSAHAPHDYQRQTPETEWEILFDEELSMQDYAAQIDYFQIEIAAVSKDGKIEYISKASQRRPEKRVGHTQSDYRLHIGWKKGTLAEADRKLLAKAGINSRGKELWHFFPTAAQVQLARLERDFAKREPSDIKRTRFRLQSKSNDDGYEFVVVEQDARKLASPRSTPASLNKPHAP